MAEVGLAHRDDDGHWRRLPFDPNTVGGQIGTAGRAKTRRDRRRREALQRQDAVRRSREAMAQSRGATAVQVDSETGEVLSGPPDPGSSERP
jgi:hypothetical protein